MSTQKRQNSNGYNLSHIRRNDHTTATGCVTCGSHDHYWKDCLNPCQHCDEYHYGQRCPSNLHRYGFLRERHRQNRRDRSEQYLAGDTRQAQRARENKERTREERAVDIYRPRSRSTHRRRSASPRRPRSASRRRRQRSSLPPSRKFTAPVPPQAAAPASAPPAPRQTVTELPVWANSEASRKQQEEFFQFNRKHEEKLFGTSGLSYNLSA